MKNILYHTIIIVFILTANISNVVCQSHSHSDINHEEIQIGHDHKNHFRVAVLIGHTLIRSEGTNSHLFIPSWGLDLEYWHTNRWGIGFHNDIEIETFIIKKTDAEEIERINPIVITLDLLHRFDNGVVLSFGPGVEYEHGDSYYLARFGVEYEKPIGNGFDISPSFFYDQRLDGFATYTLALGVGKHF